MVYMKSLSLTIPRVIFVIGKPGVGKTHFASQFAETFGAPFVESDAIRHILAGDEPTYSKQEQQIVDAIVQLQMAELLKTKKTFIVEASTEAKSDRTKLARECSKVGYEPLFVWVQTDEATAESRATRKSRSTKNKLFTMSQDRFEHLTKRFTVPGSSEESVVISGKHTYSSQVRTVLKRLAEPNRPTEATSVAIPKRNAAPRGNSIKIS